MPKKQDYVGRPHKIDARKLKELCQALEQALTLKYACDIVGLPRQTVYDSIKRDDHIRTQIELAKAKAIHGLVKLSAKQGKSWNILKNLSDGDYTDVDKLELTGNNGGPLTLVVREYKNKG